MIVDIYIVLITALIIYSGFSYFLIKRLIERVDFLDNQVQKIMKQNPRLRR